MTQKIDVEDIESKNQQQDGNIDENSEISELQEKLAALTEKLDKNSDMAVRHQAEIENISKRHRREIEKAHKYALDNMIAELLPVNDSLEMGLNAARQGVDHDKVVEGVELTFKLLQGAMTKAGVEMVDPKGQTFNPEHHEAVSMLPNAELEPNTVIEVIQKGYLLNDRLVRPAMVVVSKGS